NWIRGQYRIYLANAFEEILPVERREQAHARDYVSYGSLSGGLPLMFDVDNLLGRCGLASELFLDPIQRRPHFGILIAKPLRKLNDECSIDAPGLSHRRLKLPDQFVRLPPGDLQELISDFVGLLSRIARGNYARRKTPQVFHEGDSQCDRNRPQLADR